MSRTIIKLLGIAILGSVAISMNTVAITAEQILKKVEQKLAASTMIAEMDIRIKRPKWTKTMSLKTWAKGTDYAMAYITGPDKDKGTVYLKAKNNVYNYLPKIKKTVKLPAALLSQNWMGTDMTTDDLVKLTKLTSDYRAELTGSQMVSGRDCHVIELIPREDADVLWGKLLLCIDKKGYIQMKTVFYDEDEEVVNTMVSSDVKNLGGTLMASKMVMTPAGKKGQSTTVTYRSMKFNAPISNEFFTKLNMPKVKP
ncbi:outer membrane lipoprotein-sorting protein [Bacteroidia bacterium]|nr:outer membrane lipoprotein-sorting protein [Bacteroidia bacterium]MDB9881765.1 outer membrane lipoprotein-sorting protein [Bacteroidia bacterium]MDC1395531.1 outer membrane lipoprotein-sorting protein [Bacteroidia bacterium]